MAYNFAAVGNDDRTLQHSGPVGALSNENEQTRASSHTLTERTSDERDSATKDPIESEKQVDRELLALARSISQPSSDVGHPFEYEAGSSLDPYSDKFSPRAWAKALFQLQRSQPEHFQDRTAGFAFRNLSAWGFGSDTDFQKSVGNIFLESVGVVRRLLGNKGRRIDILQNMDGLVTSGEMLVVLGPPGSGCSTFLKTIAGETHGYYVDPSSHFNYQGISYEQMHKNFRGEAIYTAEVDVHFPMLTVGQTLGFAARARLPKNIPGGLTKIKYATFLRDVIMAAFGITHTINTKIGNELIRGVSGGERKRVTITEACLSNAPLQCWDNSTRGLDSANAIEFCKSLRTSSDLAGVTSAVAIYQSPQSAYDIFDKVLVLYKGRQIYFGRTTDAKEYFVKLGFSCPDRQTVPDFLTSMTSPLERIVREGFEHTAPRSPDEFAKCWMESPDRAKLLEDIEAFEREHPIGGPSLKAFQESRRKQQSKRTRPASAYTLSYWSQVTLCLERGFQRLRSDPSLFITQLFGNAVMALIIGSLFYNLSDETDSFFSRGALLFFAVLLNAFGSALEILTLYAQRPIVEKHERYAFYHPSAEAVASMLTDMPYKVLNTLIFNPIVYFLSNLRREPGPFFFFLFVSFIMTLAMSMLFRTIASTSRSLAGALAPAAVLVVGIVIYTGFALPVPYMLGWSRWMNYLDVVAYGFEALMANEFNNRDFPCASTNLVPPYGDLAANEQVCNTVGSVAGQSFVSGTAYIQESFQYTNGHKWRNVGIIFVFIIGFMVTYLVSAELVRAKKSKGEVLVFRRGHLPAHLTKATSDEEIASNEKAGPEPLDLARSVSHIIDRQTAIFHWEDICYDIKIKSETRRILDHVDGWVKPGTCTALMGVSGAGKTTLLDVLATRVTMGVVTGDAMVDGRQRDASFQRKADLHLETTTVREALEFSAVLRQPAHVPKAEKLEHVSHVIDLLEMTEYADAVVGVPGEGLNVEQRKRLTIGVELASKPELLLFLDEPTSGLDSQTSYAILDLLEKLKKNGQSILCTIHQPRFDRLLFLKSGGQTVYFGEVGENSGILTSYFERNGARKCKASENPAEWMLEVIGAAPGSHTDIDWHNTWRASPEYTAMKEHLSELREVLPETTKPSASASDKASYREFAAPFWLQLCTVQERVFKQYWRTPVYIYSKVALCTIASLYIGFSFFNADTSIQGLTNQMFSYFTLLILASQSFQQIIPNFVTQRALYEARERPSKSYSWKAFMISSIVVELPWNTLMSIIVFFCWYYPTGFYEKAAETGQTHIRGFTTYLFILNFFLWISTFAIMMIAAIPDAETAGNIGNLIFSLSLVFCGVIAGPNVFPRVSPFTYLVGGTLSAGLANARVVCSPIELVQFNTPADMTCQQYMQPYIDTLGGYVTSPDSRDVCNFCSINNTNAFLASISTSYDERWRNYGISWVYIVFNIAAAVGLYWLARVPKHSGQSKKEKGEKVAKVAKEE